MDKFLNDIAEFVKSIEIRDIEKEGTLSAGTSIIWIRSVADNIIYNFSSVDRLLKFFDIKKEYTDKVTKLLKHMVKTKKIEYSMKGKINFNGFIYEMRAFIDCILPYCNNLSRYGVNKFIKENFTLNGDNITTDNTIQGKNKKSYLTFRTSLESFLQ